MASLAVALWATPAAAAAPLGRLFFNAEQRTAIDHRRRLAASQPRAGAARLALDGLVWRSGGRSTAWINGEPLYQRSAPLGLSRAGTEPAQVDLQVAGRGRLRLRVGEAAK